MVLTVNEEYNGFLDSFLLWEIAEESWFSDIPLFPLRELITECKSLNPNTFTIQLHPNEVLGKRAECFFEYCLIQSKYYKVIAKNIQVFSNKTTIGELDFLLLEKTHKSIIHVEMVYKFYLYDPNFDHELSRWIGPNRKDTLLQKLDKLHQKQFPLINTPEAAITLNELGIAPSDITQQICFIAHLFVPLSLRNIKLAKINPLCIKGFWLTIEEFKDETYLNYNYYMPTKRYWGVAPKKCTTWFSYDKIIKEVHSQLSKKKSPLLWVKVSEDLYETVFIVWW